MDGGVAPRLSPYPAGCHHYAFIFPVPPDSRVIRGCGWDDSAYKNRCYQRAGFGGRLEVCACADDNCNGAVSLQSINSVLGVLCPLVIMAVFTRFF